MSEISSGLVACLWMRTDEYGDIETNTINCFSCGNTDGYPLVRLSDAKAIIAKLSSKDRYGVCDECGTPYSFDPTDGGTICVKCQKDKIAQKDAEIIEQCRINGMGAEREAALLGKMERQAERIKELEADVDEEAHIRDRMAKLLAETAVALKGPEKALHRHGWQDLPDVAAKQSAALKLAREALFDMQDSYAAVHGWKDSFVIAATTAIAAINEVLGEVK